MRKFSILVVTFLFFSLLAAAQAKKYKAVWDISSSDTALQATVFRQINNVRAQIPDVEVEIVFHGKGVFAVMKDSTQFKERIKIAKDKGVNIVVCNNSLKRLNIDPNQISSDVLVIPSAMAELIKKQADGWSYLKVAH